MAERSMLDLAQAVRAQIIKETAPKVGTKRLMTLKELGYLAVWGATAAGALMIAVLASRGEVASQRLATAFQGSQKAAGMHVFDAEAESRRLTDAVRSLATDDDRIKTRLTVVEHNMDDVTGSISQQIKLAKAATRVDDGPTVLATATASTATAIPAAPPDTVAPFAAPPAQAETEYGVDIGSGLTLQALRVRWLALRSAHPELFEGLEPIVSIKETVHTKGIELRLVVGPFAHAAAAGELCASLGQFGLFCQPTIYDGQRLAQR
jgi:hypothetical protein